MMRVNSKLKAEKNLSLFASTVDLIVTPSSELILQSHADK